MFVLHVRDNLAASECTNASSCSPLQFWSCKLLTPVPITMLMALTPAKCAAEKNAALGGNNAGQKVAC